ncbi:hypothetical protein M0R88_01950 [Halorussus gelatinilyticus]|uniref:Antibiotic biosynthesis monooxygenase n=1 Tax=Halorussus gelatinilyticus TaxID=2937524 RepID=A0A8U0IIF1_9EURY|nr:hypothetical protein [Halorussus gelatinilyticus]UPW00877.1 hypothetical protein M0R88_01950 [Halorussus gelatinilyticus]
MIERRWRGWTALEDADEYERLLCEEIFPGFADETDDGYRGFRVLRRESGAGGADSQNSADGADDESDDEAEVEFVTAMRFDSLDAVAAFAGEDYEQAHVPPEAREVLSRWDDRARHYEIRAEAEY